MEKGDDTGSDDDDVEYDSDVKFKNILCMCLSEGIHDWSMKYTVIHNSEIVS